MCAFALNFRLGHHKTPMCNSAKSKEQKRYTHRANTHEFLHFWKKDNPNLRDAARERFPKMFQVSELPKNILKLESAMKLKGMVPCVHFQQPIWKVAVECVTAIGGFKREKFFKRLRAMSKEYDDSCPEIFQEMSRLFKQGKKDNHPEVQKHLLSSSYSLISNLANKESAASWGFKHSVENDNKMQTAQKEARMMILASMIHVGFSTKVIPKVMEAVEPFFNKYAALSLGDFYVFGIPILLVKDVAYDAEAWGKPTGYDVFEMSKNISEHPFVWDGAGENFGERGGPQMRLIMGKETLSPKSGIKVISAGDTELVNAFCQGLDITPVEEVASYRDFFNLHETHFERNLKMQRKELDQEFYKLIAEICSLSEQVKVMRSKG